MANRLSLYAFLRTPHYELKCPDLLAPGTVGSATTYVLSAYFLYDSYNFSAQEPLNATLIGVSITSVLFLSGIAIAMRRGNVILTSLMARYARSYHAYIVHRKAKT